MIKKTIAAALAATMCLSLCACSDGTPQTTDIKDVLRVNPVSEAAETGDVLMGDVMPFYDGERMNVYHLKNETGTNSMWYHPIARISTTDFTHYEENGVALDFEEYFDSYDAALGTGSFIKDENGIVHCFYTGHNAELSPVEVIRHAVSADGQKTWIKDGNFYMANGSNDFRDPYLYYDEEEEKYCMLVTTRKNVSGVDTGIIARYTSPSLSAYPSEWKLDSDPFFVNDSGTFNMECPAYFRYNGYYYLTFSEQGEKRVTHYRYKKAKDGKWIKPEIDYIDGQGFYAGRPEQMNGMLYCFAWCAKTTTGDDTGEFDWAGNLVVHRLKQRPNGELYPVMIPSVRDAVNTPASYSFADGGALGDLTFSGDGFAAKAVEPIKTDVMRMHFEFELGSASGNFGLTFGVNGGDNRLGNAVMAFDAGNGAFSYYNDVFSVMRYRNALVTTPYTFEAGKVYTADVLIDGQIVSVYFNNELATTARVYNMPNKNFAFYSNGANVSFRGIKMYA